MFLSEHALRVDAGANNPYSAFLPKLMEEFGEAKHLSVTLLVEWHDSSNNFTLRSAWGVPISPFEGSEKPALMDCLRECFQMHSRPHLHSIGQSSLQGVLNRMLKRKLGPHMWFVPASCRGIHFVFLGFSDQPMKKLDPATLDDLQPIFDLASLITGATFFEKRLRVMELYVKELGHDIASSVQATIAKLKTVSRGIFSGALAIQKVQEAEQEILTTYRIADTLGITVDPDYKLNMASEFEVESAVNETLDLYKSEAQERHMELRIEISPKGLALWGDKKAIQSAVGQLLLNAIKYGKGATYVTVRAKSLGTETEISVTDFGEILDEDEAGRVWEFGFRGKRALELHVNGSGIGLYTVKKIIDAHLGYVGVTVNPDTQKRITFYFRIPSPGEIQKRFKLTSMPTPVEV